jgi:hypothetical protein
VPARPPPNLGVARRATRGFFLLAGIAAGSWAPMVPFAQARLGLDEGLLGLLLLCMGGGAVAAMPLAGWLGHRHGSRAVLAIGGAAVCVALPVLAVAPSAVALGAALVWFGGLLGVVDVAMNAHAVDVERRDGRPLMSGFHAMFSLGGLAGSAGMTALLGGGASLPACGAALAVVLLAIVVGQWPGLLAATADPATVRRPAFALPSPAALLLGALCLVIFLAEGAMLDWSAVFLRTARGVAIADAGLGYAAFSIAMAGGRLLGDRITEALGFLLAGALPWAASSVAGFALVGLGAANIVPVLFSAAGRLPRASAAVSIATVTTLGYAGMLAGPAAIGLVARATSLPVALGGVGVLVALISAAASIVSREA